MLSLSNADFLAGSEGDGPEVDGVGDGSRLEEVARRGITALASLQPWGVPLGRSFMLGDAQAACSDAS